MNGVEVVDKIAVMWQVGSQSGEGRKEYYPIQVFSESKWDAQLAILNAFAKKKVKDWVMNSRLAQCRMVGEKS